MNHIIFMLVSLGAISMLSGCANDPCHGRSSNIKGCVGTAYTTVPAVRVPAMVIPTGGCNGCAPTRAYHRPVSMMVEPTIEVRESFSPYRKTYETYCSPRQ